MNTEFVPNQLLVYCCDGEKINIDQLPQWVTPILELFAEDNDGEPLNLVKIHMGRLFIEGLDEQELMLRLNSTHFIVARIQFRHKRCGYMGRLEQILLELCRKFPEKKGVRIESVVSDEMRNYCKKNGYRRVPGCISDYLKEKENF